MIIRWQRGITIVAILAVLVAAWAWFIKLSPASEEQVLEFVVIGSGDMSGFADEAYILVRTETEWMDLWVQHTAVVMPSPPVPEIEFSSNLVVCAFMGERSTTGYLISITRIWAGEGEVHIEVVKRNSPEDLIVAQVITHPYMFVSLEKVEMDITFEITEEDGTDFEFPVPRQPDVNGDRFCGIADMVGIAEHIGSTLGESNWFPKYDINRDNYIGIDDIEETAEHFGRVY